MAHQTFGYIRFCLVAAIMLLMSACGQPRNGAAPVVNGGVGKPVQQAVARTRTPQSIRVQSGDSLYRISRRHGVRLRAIIDANNLKPPYTIYPGQKLKLPATGIHIVTRGETVYQVSQRYGVEPGALVRVNRIAPPFRLSPGQEIALPGKTTRIVSVTPSVAPTPAGASTGAPRSSPRQVKGRPPSPESSAKALPRKVLPAKRPVARRGPATSRAVQPPPASRGGFIWPVSGRLLSRFGTLGKGLQNDGINILARKGTPVRAIQNGVVAYAGNELRGFGNLLLVKHSGGWISAYAHNERLLVRTGQTVTRGQVISRVGSTGSVEKPQLHFELRRRNRAVDPERYLGRRTAYLIR